MIVNKFCRSSVPAFATVIAGAVILCEPADPMLFLRAIPNFLIAQDSAHDECPTVACRDGRRDLELVDFSSQGFWSHGNCSVHFRRAYATALSLMAWIFVN